MASSPDPTPAVLSRAATIAALVALVFYAAVTLLLFGLARHSSETTWARYIVLYTGIEAIVFAAAGALFGAKVQRAQAVAAEARATKAESQTEVVQAKAADDAQGAAAGKALKSAVEAEIAAQVATALSPNPGSRSETLTTQRVGSAGPTQSAAEPIDPALARLSELAKRLFEK
jgi:hypothetical protein